MPAQHGNHENSLKYWFSSHALDELNKLGEDEVDIDLIPQEDIKNGDTDTAECNYMNTTEVNCLAISKVKTLHRETKGNRKKVKVFKNGKQRKYSLS